PRDARAEGRREGHRRGQCAASCDVHPALESVDVFYHPLAPWGRMRFKTYGIDSLIVDGSHKFTISSRDSLRIAGRLVREFYVDSSIVETYGDAVIAALLHYGTHTDTLVTNARPGFRMNYNSYALYDDSAMMYLIESVVSRSPVWKEAYDSLYYDNDFHYLSRSGYSQDPPHDKGGKWFLP
ncbi:MAG: hypothetical protein NC115_00615, partial [Bacteroidales bacterium]|nr:hypothetical protein [Bacteroidales bacterium]